MIQRVLSEVSWSNRLTEIDLRALTPLVWSHVNPFGSFRLDMKSRMLLEPQRRGPNTEGMQLKLYDQDVG